MVPPLVLIGAGVVVAVEGARRTRASRVASRAVVDSGPALLVPPPLPLLPDDPFATVRAPAVGNELLQETSIERSSSLSPLLPRDGLDRKKGPNRRPICMSGGAAFLSNRR